MRAMTMFDDFFSRALIAGIGVAIVAGPFGCFIVWRRLAYFGDTLSHSALALLGVALGLLLQINVTLAVFAVSAFVSVTLLTLQRRASLSSDALLGLLSHSALALGLVCLAFMTWVRVDLMGFLFGDILAVSVPDILVIYGGGSVALAILFMIWRPLFAATLSHEVAEAEGLRPDRANVVFMLLMALVIAISMKIIGVLLITALLIIPAATARRCSSGPEAMAATASVIGVASVIIGLNGSLQWGHAVGTVDCRRCLAAVRCQLVAPRIPVQEQRPGTRENPAMNAKQDLTKNQSLVLDALSGAHGPLSAYTILDQLRDHGLRAPLQVYRALEKLLEYGLVHRLESLNAFVACRHPHCGDDSTMAFAICETLRNRHGVFRRDA